jgi:imidazolonepropionase-like amidohydrolase
MFTHTGMKRLNRAWVAFALLAGAVGCTSDGAVAGARQDGPIAIVHANVLTMRSDTVLHAHTVVVEEGRIAQVGPDASMRLPRGTRVIDAAGRYLVPGLIDAHVHVRAASELDSYLRHGVTTVVALRGTDTTLALREQVRSGAIPGPRILSAGPLIDGDPPIWRSGATRVVTTVEEARAEAAAQCAGDYDVVKTYSNLHADLLAAVVATAHACGLPVVSHLPRHPSREEGLARGLAANIDVIAHGEEVFFTHLGGAADALITRADARVSDAAIATAVRMIRDAGVYVIPNLSFIEMTGRLLEDAGAVFAHSEFRRLEPHVQELWRTQGPAQRPDVEAFARRERVRRAAVSELTARLHDAGVPLLVGTDASAPGLFPGWSTHLELELLVRTGLTPFDALVAATRTPGAFFVRHLRSRDGVLGVGTIEQGRAADLLLLDGNPLEDVRHLRRLDGVMVRGIWRPAPSDQHP